MGRSMGHSSPVVRVSKAEAAAPAGQVFRLSDMDVEEVSLVDRAANKKKFLVVKRSDQMATEVQPDGKGGFTSNGGTTKAGAPPPPPPGKDPKKKPPPGAPAAGAAAAPAAKAGSMEVPPGFKEAIAPILDKATAQLEALQESVSSSKPADVPDDGTMPGVPADFSNGVMGVMTLLDRATSMWPSAPEDAEDALDGGADEAQEGDVPGAGAPAEMQMRLVTDGLAKLLKRNGINKAVVQKIGAKMSKDRLTRLQQAVSQLANLVNEVAGAPPTPPTGAPPVGKAKDKKDDAMKTAGAPDPVLAAIADLAGTVNQLAGVVKTHGEGLDAIKKSRSAPSGGPVETTGGPVRKSADVSWPMDLNNPITRDTVGKNESFFDD